MLKFEFELVSQIIFLAYGKLVHFRSVYSRFRSFVVADPRQQPTLLPSSGVASIDGTVIR